MAITAAVGDPAQSCGAGPSVLEVPDMCRVPLDGIRAHWRERDGGSRSSRKQDKIKVGVKSLTIEEHPSTCQLS